MKKDRTHLTPPPPLHDKKEQENGTAMVKVTFITLIILEQLLLNVVAIICRFHTKKNMVRLLYTFFYQYR